MRKYAPYLLLAALMVVGFSMFVFSGAPAPRADMMQQRSDMVASADPLGRKEARVPAAEKRATRDESVRTEEAKAARPGPIEIIAGDRPEGGRSVRKSNAATADWIESPEADSPQPAQLQKIDDLGDRSVRQVQPSKPRAKSVSDKVRNEQRAAMEKSISADLVGYDAVAAGRRGTPPTTEEARQLQRVSKRLRERRPLPPTAPAEPASTPTPDAIGEIAADLKGFENKAQDAQVAVAHNMTSTADEPTSTFGVDVDTGSYALARARLRAGYPPKVEHVRIEEFLNYFAYDYGQPKEGEFAVHFEAAPDPFDMAGRRHLLQIGIQGKSVPDAARPPAHLTFVIDVSGSMFGPDGVGLVIEALDLVTRNLRPDDTIALVTFAREARVAMWPAGAGQRDVVAATIAKIEAGGSSALDAGLRLGYEVASTHFYAGHINRVVLIGDGRANVGERDPAEILASVRSGVEDGVMLSTIGFGAKSFNDEMMERLADKGDGNYFFVDSYREAQQVFGDRLCGTLFAIAKDVKIQVEFNPKTVVRYRLLGYENRKLTKEQFRDDAVDAGEIGAGHQVTALYEIELAPEVDKTVATVSVRYKKPNEARASEINYQFFSEEVRDHVRGASADFKFAAAVALFAQVARGDLPGDADRLSLIQEIAGEGITRPEDQLDRVEFAELVGKAAPFFTKTRSDMD